MAEYLSHNEAETEGLGCRLAAVLTPGAVVAYRGGLGRGLGVSDRVTSPTFTIVNEYEGGRLPLFHFDMYRLEGAGDLFDIGWEDYLDRGGVCAVEWSERAEEALPPEKIVVTISRCPENPDWRTIAVEGVELS